MSVFSLFEPGVWATYIIGALAICIGIIQFKKTFKLNKKAAVFEKLSKDIEEASTQINNIGQNTDNIINQLSRAANAASSSPAESGPTYDQEIDRRLNEIKETWENYQKYIEAIYSSYLKVLALIKNVEKSTGVSKKSRQAARYLFYAATEQHELVEAASKVLQSFDTTPALGKKPNISSETFNAFVGLINIITPRNQIIDTYLEDLEVILHNDLVKSIYGKAKFASMPTKHLRATGLTDKRTEDSLI